VGVKEILTIMAVVATADMCLQLSSLFWSPRDPGRVLPFVLAAALGLCWAMIKIFPPPPPPPGAA
jgi:uncharacterized membrane protein YccC